MTKQQEIEKNEAVEELRSLLSVGTKVYTVLRHVSASGMSRDIDVYVMVDNEPRRITWTVGKATGMTYNRKAEALRVGGCGMDMGFHVVYNLSRALFQGGHACSGEGCPSNDHSNAYSAERQGQCMVCRKTLVGDHKWTRKNGSQHHDYQVCSEVCAHGVWLHSDGGYALKHSWM